MEKSYFTVNQVEEERSWELPQTRQYFIVTLFGLSHGKKNDTKAVCAPGLAGRISVAFKRMRRNGTGELCQYSLINLNESAEVTASNRGKPTKKSSEVFHQLEKAEKSHPSTLGGSVYGTRKTGR